MAIYIVASLPPDEAAVIIALHNAASRAIACRVRAARIFGKDFLRKNKIMKDFPERRQSDKTNAHYRQGILIPRSTLIAPTRPRFFYNLNSLRLACVIL